MRIGLSGRIGVGIMLFAAVADGASWLVRAIDNYPFDFYRQIDAYLPVVFFFGLALFLPSISIALQTKRAANLAKFPLTTAGPLPPELRWQAGQVESGDGANRRSAAYDDEIPAPKLAFVPSISHRRLLKWFAYSSFLAAVILYGGLQRWMATRIFIPLQVSISLVRGHNRTAEFQTNLRAVYLIRLTLPESNDPGCRLRYGPAPPVLWRLLRSGRSVAEGMLIKPEPYSDEAVGRFEVPSGLYSLDVDFPANCATGVFEYPSLEVEVDPHAFRSEGGAQLIVVILFALGVALLFWPDVRETEELSLQGEVRATYRGVALVGRSLQPLIALMKPLSSLRVWSYMWLMVLAFVWVVFVTRTPLTYMGLKVYVPKPGTYALATDKPWKEPLVLRIDALGNLYLNRVPVRFADLGERLEKALSLRADWTVFVDADPDVNAGEVIGAVDLIHGIGGTKVFLVTLSMKKEKPEFAILPPCESKAPHPPELRLPLKWRDVRFYEYPDVSFVVNESGEVSNVKIQRKGDYPEFAEWLARSARKLKYPPAPGCGKHELNVGYYW